MKSRVPAGLTIPSPLQESWQHSGPANDFSPGGPSCGAPGIILPGLPEAAGGMGSPERVPVILSSADSPSVTPSGTGPWQRGGQSKPSTWVTQPGAQGTDSVFSVFSVHRHHRPISQMSTTAPLSRHPLLPFPLKHLLPGALRQTASCLHTILDAVWAGMVLVCTSRYSHFLPQRLASVGLIECFSAGRKKLSPREFHAQVQGRNNNCIHL